MYPDTDLPPTALEEDYIQSIKSKLPEYPWNLEKWCVELQLPDDITVELLRSPFIGTFKRIITEIGTNPILVGSIMIRMVKELKRTDMDTNILDKDFRMSLFQSFQEGKFAREAFKSVLVRFLQNPHKTFKENLESLDLKPIKREQLDKVIGNIFLNHKKILSLPREKLIRWFMGLIMKDVSGKFSGRDVYNRLNYMIEKRKQPYE
ncbi:MAG: hypothetical protein A2161_16715 [Candidatus Schekmanbacteria bacterium RBG_13_48_7]|uniref:Asn/Gln amidotransferase domain-containing protein n=1 Tax=Candidatus Schekmanbacteria bacterium RBG_13_48_7 TaxID=1817878 RepID=A0A1F7RWT2_9BACT|nr:MAG: hypothetical protein A2161_16715 [Candidatus Schekmanbacteria bacterium RBG_13_48_7]